MRQMPRVAVIQPFRTARTRYRVAAMVEHGEAVPMFQRPRPPLMERRRRRDEELRLRLRQRLPRIHAVTGVRSEEHTSKLQSLMRISYAVFCLKKHKTTTINMTHTIRTSS